MSKNKRAYFDTTYYNTLRDALTGMGAAYGGKPAVTWYDRGGAAHTKSYSDLMRDAAGIARALDESGLCGKHAAIVSENSYEWLCAFFAIVSTGGVAVLVDTEQSAGRLCAAIRLADAEMIIASDTIAPLIRSCALEAGLPLLCVGECEGIESLFEFAGDSPASDGEALSILNGFHPKGENTAVIAFTSGTSGQPKPVMLSQSGLARNASESIAMVKPSERVFSSLPFYHTYGLTCGALCILFSGAELGINGDVKRVVRDLTQFNPQIMMAVPLMVEMLHKRLMLAVEKAGARKRVDRALAWFDRLYALGIRRPVPKLLAMKEAQLGCLRLIVCGGAHLSRAAAAHMEALGVTVLEGYGITECSPLVSVNRLCDRKPFSVGKPLPSYRVRVEEGEIYISGPSLMRGYYKDEAATAAVMAGEWFRTGDMGEVDENGFLTITGRKKNLIVLKNGKKIAPEEIEGYLKGTPLVKEVSAHSAPAGDSADDVKLAVTVYPDEEAARGMTAYEVLEVIQREVDAVNSRLPTYKQIQMVSLRTQEFEKTASQKIKR